MNRDKFILSIESDGKKYTSEMNWDASMEDILQSFYGLLIATSYMPDTILRNMKEFSENVIEALNND